MLSALLLAACTAAAPPNRGSAIAPEFRPDIFFAGITRGHGTLVARGRPPEPFTVISRGRVESPNRFHLDQTVSFANGRVESRTWQIHRVDANHYSASLSDAAGKVSADTRGNLFHLRYLVRRPAIYMEQWLYLQPDGRTVLNIGRVKVLGVLLAQLSETIVCVQ